jgi:hypothetical protein
MVRLKGALDGNLDVLHHFRPDSETEQRSDGNGNKRSDETESEFLYVVSKTHRSSSKKIVVFHCVKLHLPFCLLPL